MDTTLRLPSDRQSWAKLADGSWETVKAKDEVESYTIDLAQRLGATETIASSAWDNVSGVTITAAVPSTQALAVSVTGIGEARNTVTTSTGRKIQTTLRWRDPSDSASDYT